MVRISVMHDALKTMHNAEKRGKRQVLLRPSSKVVIKFLQVMMKHGARPPCRTLLLISFTCCMIHRAAELTAPLPAAECDQRIWLLVPLYYIARVHVWSLHLSLLQAAGIDSTI